MTPTAASSIDAAVAPDAAHQSAPGPDAPSPSPLPRHIAIIMDGNGRWATQRDLPRSEGHRRGAERVPPLVTRCSNLGIEALTLYSFSTENWTRSHEEIDCLMDLYVEYLLAPQQIMLDNNVRFRHLGRIDGLPGPLTDALRATTELTAKGDGLTLCLALNYGSRAEITRAVRRLARRVAAGDLDPEAIDEAALSAELDTAGLPDPDLLIRTAGEMRISNYLLWQISYAELYVTDAHWPDFDEAQLDRALAAYAARQRRFGGVRPKAKN